MSKISETAPQVVYIVTCYQNIIGVYAAQIDAVHVQSDMIAKNRPADVLCRSIFYSYNSVNSK